MKLCLPVESVDIAAIQKLANDINLDIGSDEELSGDDDELMVKHMHQYLHRSYMYITRISDQLIIVL